MLCCYASCAQTGSQAASSGEYAMAKGQAKSNKEVKKPKADKNVSKGAGSAYKQAQGKGGSLVDSSGRKS
jgi:hypothetical protein